MNLDRSEIYGRSQMAPTLRKAWMQPAVCQLRAGSAENIPGSAFSDATLETIGS